MAAVPAVHQGKVNKVRTIAPYIWNKVPCFWKEILFSGRKFISSETKLLSSESKFNSLKTKFINFCLNVKRFQQRLVGKLIELHDKVLGKLLMF